MKSLKAFALAAAIIWPGLALASHLPAPSGYVNDFAEVIDSTRQQALETTLVDFEKRTSNEVSVAVVKSLDGGDIDDFAVRAFEEWKPGKADKDNGVLLLVAIEDRKLRIEVDYGAEEQLTDAEAGAIIRNEIAPKFKTSDCAGGIEAGVKSIMGQLNGEPSPEGTTKSTGDWMGGLFGLLGGALAFISYLFAYMARSKSIKAGAISGAGLGGAGAALAGVNPLGIALTAVLVGGLGALLDWVLSRAYSKAPEKSWLRSWGGFYVGGSGGNSFGGGGFGGFGGGSSGGGGASGDR